MSLIETNLTSHQSGKIVVTIIHSSRGISISAKHHLNFSEVSLAAAVERATPIAPLPHAGLGRGHARTRVVVIQNEPDFPCSLHR
jgi:hypothetical protein